LWIVACFKKKEFQILLDSLNVKFKQTLSYIPKYNLDGQCKYLLGNYCFLFNPEFNKGTLSSNKYLKGLNYFLEGSLYYQNEIKAFIDNLKSFENDKSDIQPDYFYKYLNQSGKFFKGPLKNLLFDVLEKKDKFLKVSIEGWNYPITINNPKLSVVGIPQ